MPMICCVAAILFSLAPYVSCHVLLGWGRRHGPETPRVEAVFAAIYQTKRGLCSPERSLASATRPSYLSTTHPGGWRLKQQDGGYLLLSAGNETRLQAFLCAPVPC